MDFMDLLGRWREGDDGVYNAFCFLLTRQVLGRWRRLGPLPESISPEESALLVSHKLMLWFRKPSWRVGEHGIRSVLNSVNRAASWAHTQAWREERRRPGPPPLPLKKKGREDAVQDPEERTMDNLKFRRVDDEEISGIARRRIFDALYSLCEKDQEVVFVCGVGIVPNSTYARLAGTTTRNVDVWFSRAAKRLLARLGVSEADGPWLRKILSGDVEITFAQIAGVADARHRKVLERLYAHPDPRRRARSLTLWLKERGNPGAARRLLWAALVSLMKTRRVLKGDPRREVRRALGSLLQHR